jgi:hypothetical protein
MEVVGVDQNGFAVTFDDPRHKLLFRHLAVVVLQDLGPVGLVRPELSVLAQHLSYITVKRWTKILIVVVTVALVTYTTVALLFVGDDATISAVMTDWAERHALVPMSAGAVTGHWFWPPRPIARFGPAVLIVWALIVLLLDVFRVMPRVMPIISFTAGVVAGGMLWGSHARSSD